MLYYKGIKAFRVAELNRWVIFGERLEKAGFNVVHRKASLDDIIEMIDIWFERGYI